jgi:alpha-D-ribose 1-methylphosphonate 5-triphosphate diphosphatase
VRWPALPALLIHDALISSAGITTVLDAMGVGDFDENSVRAQGLQAATQALRHARQRDLLRAEHLLHLRCEIACDNMLEVVTPFLDDPTVRLVSIGDIRPDNASGWTCSAFASTRSAISAGATSTSSR